MTLRQTVDLVMPMLRRASGRMWAAQHDARCYREWLCVCHDLVRATAPLLTEALAESVRHGDSLLVDYFAEQLAEEFGHDRWVEQDLAAAGFDPGSLADRVPVTAAARLVGAQYYWIRHAHPVALLGHIAVLEWLPPRADLAHDLAERTGLSTDAFRTLARHADLDVAHGRRLDEVLAGLPVDGRHRRLVTTSALTTAHGLVELMTDLVASMPATRPSGEGGRRHEPIPSGPAGVRHTVRQR
ncbi:iron-containing redox enzyme family protein [Catellatospora tritici]|uniref:iron-containing redox enzyme family protein n=1 Tax=Catellatospora tritici TaxID=2851566 RepID=UPI001C2D0D49|nr:iron-containing redox enzyme family protein [Catellatospora tritici]MBV1850641.1 iron-containing redox enzyme family protein [Catellatospora tritici]